jgi:hypothetical protein
MVIFKLATYLRNCPVEWQNFEKYILELYNLVNTYGNEENKIFRNGIDLELEKYNAKFIHDSNSGYSVEFETEEDLLVFKLKFS